MDCVTCLDQYWVTCVGSKYFQIFMCATKTSHLSRLSEKSLGTRWEFSKSLNFIINIDFSSCQVMNSLHSFEGKVGHSWNWVSYCSIAWPGTHLVAQADFSVTDSPALGSKCWSYRCWAHTSSFRVHTTHPDLGGSPAQHGIYKCCFQGPVSEHLLCPCLRIAWRT